MIRIEYSNVCDLDNVLFSAGYVQNIYLDVEEMFAPEYEYFEDGTEDRNRNFIPSFKKQTKRQVFRVMATPYMAECLQNIPLCKSITIEIDGEINKCELFSCSIADTVNKGKYYLMECSYQVDQIISTGCCSNIRPTECLQTNVDDVLDIIDCDSSTYTDPQNNITEDSRYLVDFSNCESKLAQGYNIEIMVYSVRRGEWGHSQDNAPNNYVYNLDDDLYYFYNGSTWLVNPSIVSITNVAGNTYKIVGNAINGFVAVQATTDEVTWVDLDTFYASEIGNGVEVDILGTYTHIRLYQYSHGCDGTYGVSTASPNASDYISFTGVPVSAFAIDIGEVSASKNITVTEGVDATTNVVLTAPTGFQISQDDSTWLTSITLTVGYGSDVIYIRAASDSAGTYSSNITAVVDSTTFNIAVYSVVTCSIAWISDWADDLENDTLTGYVEEKLDYITDTKDDIKTAIEAKGVTINPTDTFRDYATRIGSISTVCTGWSPPTDWGWETLEATIGSGDNKIVGLAVVYPTITNYCSIKFIYTGAAGGTIDWGDGSAAGVIPASGTTIEHTFSYAGITAAATSMGYKVAEVKFNFNGVLTNFSTATHSVIGTAYAMPTPWLALKIRTTNASIGYVHYNPFNAGNLCILDLGTTPISPSTDIFTAHSNLKSITFTPPTSNSNWAYGLCRGGILSISTSLVGFDFSSKNVDFSTATSMYEAFYFAQNSNGMFEAEIDNVTSLYTAFRQSDFKYINLENTGNVTNIARAIYQSDVMYFAMDDASAVTNTSLFVRTVSGYGALIGLILTGLTIGIDLSNQEMDATAIDAFFTSLGTASGAQTIIVTGNPGAAGCTTSIATTKGFTVTT